MSRPRRHFLTSLVILALGFALTTWIALESGGVGVVTTTQADGEPRQTHVWPVEINGVVWIEAGSAGNGWYVDVLEQPRLVLERDGQRSSYVAVPVPTKPAHQDLRAAIERAYGWRARWVEIWVDPSESIPVRLEEPAGDAVFD